MRPIISEPTSSSVDVTGQWHVVDIDFLSEFRVELESQNMKNRGQPKNRAPRVVDASIIPPRGLRPKYFSIGTLSPAIRRILEYQVRLQLLGGGTTSPRQNHPQKTSGANCPAGFSWHAKSNNWKQEWLLARRNSGIEDVAEMGREANPNFQDPKTKGKH